MFAIEQRREPRRFTIRASLKRAKVFMLLVAAGASVILLARLVGRGPILGRVS